MRPLQKTQFGLQRYNYFLILPNYIWLKNLVRTKN